MKLPPQYRVAQQFEHFLGDPTDSSNIISYQEIMDLDEREEFPSVAMGQLHQFGLRQYYVPAELGGQLTSFEEVMELARIISRRDLTMAISFSTLIWTILVWIGGSTQQKKYFADLVLSTEEYACLAYSEIEHGADLLANEMVAQKEDNHYILNGEKMPINRATYSGIIALLAKTSEDKGPRSQSLFMIDKRNLNSMSYRNLSRVKTYGLRGGDISGLHFENCKVSEQALIGAEGKGLEIALKGFQVTRTLCAGLSLGAADTALRTVVKFAKTRRLYGFQLIDLPHAKHILTETFLDILICDCVGTVAVRGLHLSTEQFSVWSSIVKYFVPHTIEHAIQNLAVVLGARYYFREKHVWGIFQKCLRDNAVVSLFDGSSVVCLHTLTLQLKSLAKYRLGQAQDTEAIAPAEQQENLFCLQQELPAFEPNRLQLFGRGYDDVMQGFTPTVRRLESLEGHVDNEVLSRLKHISQALLETLHNLDKKLLLTNPIENGHLQSQEQFELAESYCTLHAAATCLQFWFYNRADFDDFFADGLWLVAALHKLMPGSEKLPARYLDNVANQICHLYDTQRLFGIVPLELAHRC